MSRSTITRTAFDGVLTFVRVDSATGQMAIAFQIRLPAFDYDLSHAGKGPSHGWSFFTSYNSEQGNTKLEVNASQNDKDFIAAINWKQAESCVAAGKVDHRAGSVRAQPDGAGRHRQDRLGKRSARC